MRKEIDKVVCSKCGKLVEVYKISSFFVSDSELDGKPVDLGAIPQIETCPNCGYRNLDIRLEFPRDHFGKAFFNLVCAWNAEDAENFEEANNFREKAAEFLEDDFRNSLDAPKIVLYIDLMRRIGNFRKAKQVIDMCNNVFCQQCGPGDRLFKTFQYEAKLIAERDSKPHLMSEALGNK